ncbi:hypothetical protein M5K25_013518 [Dendrobium thyrsiflorum]|uniref:Uncharacterized protein n=1 Tax=Dendrobium thyrsiflorum TaxID=117978 RepID=A0ABD0UT78_DENTH
MDEKSLPSQQDGKVYLGLACGSRLGLLACKLQAGRSDGFCMGASRIGHRTKRHASEGRMELHNTPFTVQLGRGASIQLANTVINTGDSEATIRFGSLEFPLTTAMAATVPIHVFERLSHPKVSTVKRTDIKQKTLPILSNVITLPTKPFILGWHDHEASSSGGRLSRRQRRKLNAELRARQPLPVHPSTLPALELEANIPTQNKFVNLKWVKWNSSTGELKQSF